MRRATATLISSKLRLFSNPNRPNPISNPNLNPSSSLRHHLPKSRSPQIASNSSQNPNSKALVSICAHNRFFASVSRPSSARHDLVEIVELIRGDEINMESSLNRKKISQAAIAEILRSLNDHNAPASRFFNWALSSSSGFKPTPETYNLVVDNLGRLNDFKTMCIMLKELSLKQHCLTEQAFAFLRFRSSSSLDDSVREVTEILNKVGGSCRGSGIHSLIKVLCKISYDLALSVMEETVRKTSYYNVLIAAKCKRCDFQDACNVLDEMRRFGCDPNMNSYNYLLASLFKHKRIVEACDLMETMEDSGYFPDPVTFEIVTIHACTANKIDFAMEFLNRMLSQGISPRLTTHAAFIKGYFFTQRVEDAYKYVIDMSVRDKGSANMNYSLLARLLYNSKKVVEAGGILNEMMGKGLKPNFPVYVKVMKDLNKMSRGDLSSQLKSMSSKFTLNKVEARRCFCSNGF